MVVSVVPPVPRVAAVLVVAVVSGIPDARIYGDVPGFWVDRIGVIVWDIPGIPVFGAAGVAPDTRILRVRRNLRVLRIETTVPAVLLQPVQATQPPQKCISC